MVHSSEDCEVRILRPAPKAEISKTSGIRDNTIHYFDRSRTDCLDSTGTFVVANEAFVLSKIMAIPDKRKKRVRATRKFRRAFNGAMSRRNIGCWSGQYRGTNRDAVFRDGGIFFGHDKLLTMEPQKTTVLQEHEGTKVTGSRYRTDEKRRIEAPSAQTGHAQPWSSFEETMSDGRCPGNAEEFYPRYQGVEESAIENPAVDLQVRQLRNELFVSKAEDRPVELLACSLEAEHLVCGGNADSYRASKHTERVETKLVAKKVEGEYDACGICFIQGFVKSIDARTQYWDLFV